MSTANLGLLLVILAESMSLGRGAVIRKISVMSIRSGTGVSATWLKIELMMLWVLASIRAFMVLCF
jgi:hypothetical protein